jgi:hypothetical protein
MHMTVSPMMSSVDANAVTPATMRAGGACSMYTIVAAATNFCYILIQIFEKFDAFAYIFILQLYW